MRSITCFATRRALRALVSGYASGSATIPLALNWRILGLIVLFFVALRLDKYDGKISLCYFSLVLFSKSALRLILK
jgi:hypothetical protein